LSYQNEAIRRHDLWDGVPGVALFLADYAAITGSAEASELARRVLAWSVAQARIAPSPDPPGPNLGRGAAGMSLAYLHLARIDTAALDRAAELAAQVAEAPPAQNPSLLWGTAGEIVLLLRVWEATHEEAFRSAAMRRGAMLGDETLPGVLAAVAQRPIPLGLAPGLAGIGIALAALHAADSGGAGSASIRHVADALLTRGRADDLTADGLAWPTRTDADAPLGYQWCIGTPGVGLFFAAAAAALDDADLRATALAAGETTYAHGDAKQNLSLCHGLSGSAELLIELYRLTREARWLERATEFAERAFAYCTTSPEGDIWPADEPGLVAPNLSTGAAGVGRLFLQLLAPDKTRALFL